MGGSLKLGSLLLEVNQVSPIIDDHSSLFNPGSAEIGTPADGVTAISSAWSTNITCSRSALSANFCTARRAMFWLARSKDSLFDNCSFPDACAGEGDDDADKSD